MVAGTEQIHLSFQSIPKATSTAELNEPSHKFAVDTQAPTVKIRLRPNY